MRYGHTAVIYEPATTHMLDNLKSNLRLADINKRASDNSQESKDTSYMIVFGGKNAERDVLFNDIYFLGIPSFDWYIPQLSVLNQAEAPSPRLGHVAAIAGNYMYVFGGHTVPNAKTNLEISNELFVLDL